MGSTRGYYDLDCILAESERVPALFNVNAMNLGFLDNTNDEADLEKGFRTELPFWLVEVLAERNYVEVLAPKCYMHKFRTHLLADPTVVSLRDRCPYYYILGSRLSRYFRDVDRRMLMETFVRALSVRYREILDRCQNSGNEDTTSYTKTLAHTEQLIFAAGYDSANEQTRWKRRDGEKLTSYRPRKRRRRL